MLTPEEQNRLDELTGQRAWLSNDLKNEYYDLKNRSSNLAETQAKEEETVTVKKEDLMKMVQEAAKTEVEKYKKHALLLERETGLGDWKDSDDDGNRVHVARFKLYRPNTDEDFKLIVDWKHLRFDYDENTRGFDKDIYKITLMDEEGDLSHAEVNLRDFANIKDYEKVQVIEMNKKEQTKSLGRMRKAPRKGNYILSTGGLESGLSSMLNIEPGGPMVEQLVTRQYITCTVKRPSGQIFECNADRLNA